MFVMKTAGHRHSEAIASGVWAIVLIKSKTFEGEPHDEVVSDRSLDRNGW